MVTAYDPQKPPQEYIVVIKYVCMCVVTESRNKGYTGLKITDSWENRGWMKRKGRTGERRKEKIKPRKTNNPNNENKQQTFC